ncbi:DUF481 domain-containing protein [Mangrovimonas aestuarii]|uniref:DUF481 domain-containing protein n=1 Tax=Mangrovimonas aestuarii TaxID=3018443 RepID=UPI002377E92D|nr:DUF481 domain-containing protein [Mangrovimonas aestuarii]
MRAYLFQQLKNLALTFLLFTASLINGLAQNDTLVLKNGNQLIGEIKNMENGVLDIETDYSDSDFQVKWLEIVSVNSKQTFLITLTNGDRINSNLVTKPKDSAKITLNEAGKVIVAPIEDIVYIKAIKKSFLSRLDASFSVGFNIAKSDNLKQFTVRSSLGYTANRWYFSGGYNSVRSNQDNTEETQRTDGNVGAKYFMERDWYAQLQANFLSNEEQKLKLRTAISGGLGKYFIHNNKLYFGGGAGLAWNNEQFYDSEESSRNSLEAYGGLELQMFNFDDISVLTNVAVYPSLTESDRVRLDYTLDLKYDIFEDFFIKLGLTYNYDSKPIEGGSASDYVLQTTFGWDL